MKDIKKIQEFFSRNEPVKEAEFKNINKDEHNIKLAIKDVEKKFRLKANRDNPPQYAQLSLNKIMLSKVLGREELGKEHQGAWEKLKKEYNLRDAVNEGKWMDLWDESQDKAPSAWTKHQKWIVANAERYGFDPIKVKKLLRQHL